MDIDKRAELEQLRKDYLEAERVYFDEKKCLLKVINTFSTVVAMHPEYAEELGAVKKKVNTDKVLPLDLIEKEIGKFRSKVFSKEIETRFDEGENELKERLLESCRITNSYTLVKYFSVEFQLDPLGNPTHLLPGLWFLHPIDKTHTAQISACAESAPGTLKNDDLNVIVFFRLMHRSFPITNQLRGHGIQFFGPVKGNVSNVATRGK